MGSRDSRPKLLELLGAGDNLLIAVGYGFGERFLLPDKRDVFVRERFNGFGQFQVVFPTLFIPSQ